MQNKQNKETYDQEAHRSAPSSPHEVITMLKGLKKKKKKKKKKKHTQTKTKKRLNMKRPLIKTKKTYKIIVTPVPPP